MRSILLLSTMFLLALAGGPAGAEPGRVIDGTVPRARARETRRIILEPGQARVELDRTFIIPGSDSVTLDGSPLVRGAEYRINTLKGTMVLVSPATGGERLEVRFSRYPFSFSPLFASRLPAGEEQMPLSRPGVEMSREESKGDGRFNLRFSGSKTVGASAGTGKGLGIEQDLKISVAGKIAEDLEINAFLTDDDLRVQPEGNTEELRYLEKVYVQIKSRHSDVLLGDFDTGLDWSSFSSFKRELRGGMAKVTLGDRSALAGAGTAKGRFRTASFFGVEGVQGPYELLSARRFNGVVILPGSETVYLDGRVLRRGSENGYTIDYNRGTITFTERVPVTDDSEIVVDYQISEDDYDRSTLMGGIDTPLIAGDVNLRIFFSRESDNEDKPTTGDLTDEDRNIIAEAGDDPDGAVASGVQEVGPGEGDYVLVSSDSLPDHFVFVESEGNYRLDFFEVGAGKGDYAPDGYSASGILKFAFAGEGEGDYIIGRILSLPQRKQVFTIGLSAKRGIFFADAEGNMSLYDKNILSGRDDGDNAGGAVAIRGGLVDAALPGSKLAVTGSFSSLEGRFAPLDKPRQSYFYRNWNLDDVPLAGRERISGLEFRLSGDREWVLSGSHEYLSRDTLAARKSTVDASVGKPSMRGIGLRAMDSEVEQRRDRRFVRAEGAYALWHIVPGVQYETERYRAFEPAAPDTGRFYQQGAVSLGTRDTGPFRGVLSLSRRDTDRLSGDGLAWLDSRENDEIRFEGSYAGPGRMVDLVLTHRTTIDEGTGISSSNDLARFRLRDTWETMDMANDISYRITSGVERAREKTVVYVGENQGDYDSEGREVGKNRGDYTVLYLPSRQLDPLRAVELSWRLSFGGGVRGVRAGTGEQSLTGKIRRNVSCDNFFSVLEKSRTDEFVELYTLQPYILQRNGLTIYGLNRLRSEWNLLGDVKRMNIRFVYTREDEEDNRSEGTPIDRFNSGATLRIETAPTSNLTLSVEGGNSYKSRQTPSAFEQNYRVESVFASQTSNYRFGPSVRASFELGAEKRRDEVSGAEQVSYMTTPSVTAAVGKGINITSFVRITFTDSQEDAGKPLFFLEDGWRQDWSFIANYRVIKHISFGLNYTGRREKDFLGEVETIHDFKIESRAYF
jgi:hypothetical protein